jgi:tRNA-dihydrouridine synthase
MNFWDKLSKPFFVLAPMEDVTDVVFRQVVARAARPDVFMTEFMNVSGFCHPDGHNSVARRLEFSLTEQPIVAQIWGSRPADFSLTAQKLAEMGFAGIDINMGCPDKAVVKSGGGSALIRNPELAGEIIVATKRGAGDLPVSVKTRLGDTRVDEWTDWLTHLLKHDLANLTVHLRTRKEMSKAPAHYELIDEILRLRDQIAPQTLITINGDIKNRTDGLALAKKHPGLDGIMIGRGIFENPFCFEKNPTAHTRAELFKLLNYHLDSFDQLNPAGKFEPLKKFFKIYINNFPGAQELRAQLMQTKTTDEARNIIRVL